MRYAVVKNNVVENVIVAKEENKEEMETLLNATLVDTSVYNLQIGDMKLNDNWTRNQDGEQIILTENATYDELVAYIATLEAALKGTEVTEE